MRKWITAAAVMCMTVAAYADNSMTFTMGGYQVSWPVVAGTNFPADWGYKVEITIDATDIDADLADWTMVFDESFATSIFYAVNGPLDSDGTKASLSGGGDIRFSSVSNGTTRIACDIRTWITGTDPTTGTCEVAVLVPSVSSSADTSIWMWWGNAGQSQPAVDATYGQYAAYDSDHIIVYPCNDGAAGYNRCSSSYSVPTEAQGTEVSGTLGKAQSFSASTSQTYDTPSDVTEIVPEQSFTVEAIAQIDRTDKDFAIALKASAAGNYVPINMFRDDLAPSTNQNTLTGFVQYSGSGVNDNRVDAGNGVWADTNPHHVVTVFSAGSHVRVLLDGNGASDTSLTNSTMIPEDNSEPIRFGNEGSSTYGVDLDGTLDEIRVSTTDRADAWLKANYNNQFNITGFITSGTIQETAEEEDNEYPQFSNYSDNNATLTDSGTALFNVSITHTNGTVFLEINETNYTATSLGDNAFNITLDTLGAGTYAYYWGSWGNGTSANYNVSETRYYTINATIVEDNEYPQFTNIGFNITNGSEYNSLTYLANATISNTNSTAGIEFDGTNYSATNLSDLFESNLGELGVGTYEYYWWAYGNGTDENYNTSSVSYYTINKTTPVITVLLNGVDSNLTVEYPQQVNISASTTGGTLKIFKNATDITALNGQNQTFQIGYYNIIFNVTGNQNYSDIANKTYYVNVSDTIGPICTLISRTPTDINDSSSGILNVIMNCTDVSGINVSKNGDHYYSFVTRTVDAFTLSAGVPNYWSVRYPNNSLSVTGDLTPPYKIWRALGRNEGYWYESLTNKNLTSCEGVSPCYAPLNDTFSYSIEDGEYGHYTITQESATSAIINFTHHAVSVGAFRQVVYLDCGDMVTESKKNASIIKGTTVLVKGFDPEAYRNTANYSANLFLDIGVENSPSKPLQMYYCNSSYSPAGSTQPMDSSNCILANVLSEIAINNKLFTEKNSSYIRGTFSITNGRYAGIKTTAEYYLQFRTDNTAVGKNYLLKYVNGSTVTNVKFNDTKVAWTSTNAGVTWTQALWTPDIFTTFVKEANDEFQLGYYVTDLKGNAGYNFTFIEDPITPTNHPISNPFIIRYNSTANINDVNKNATHKGIMNILINTATDPDSVGNVTHNLSLMNTDGTQNYTINASFKAPLDLDMWINFNTSLVKDGIYRMKVIATSGDNPLDIKSYITIDNFTIDNTAPEITNLTYQNETGILNGTIRHDRNITINATVTDSDSVSSVWIKIWQGAIGISAVLFEGVLTLVIDNLWSVDITTNSSFPIGEVNYTIYANDSSNNINQVNGTYNQSKGVDNEYPQFTNTGFNYPNNTQFNEYTYLANTTITSTNGTVGIEFNGVNYTATNISNLFSYSLGELSVGTYGYYWWAYGNGTSSNYNITTLSYYTISQNISLVLGISGTTPISYPTITDVAGSGCPSQLTCSLSPSNAVFGVSTQTFNYSTSGNTNYSASSITKDITINQNNTYGLSVSGSTPLYNDTAGNFQGNGCPGELTCILYRDGVNVSNPDTSYFAIGNYTYHYNSSGNANYSDMQSANATLVVIARPGGGTTVSTLTVRPTGGHLVYIKLGENIDFT